MQANRRDLCGQRFGKLTVIRRVEGTQSNRARADSWLCRCDCGNESVVLGSNLVRGHTKSCGCIKLNDLTGQHIGSRLYLADRTSTRPEGKGVYASGSVNAIAGPLHIKQQIP